MNFLTDWLPGGIVVVGLLQWIKGMAPKNAKINRGVWAAFAALFSIGWAFSPPWLRQGLGVLAVSQIGYETIIQTIRTKLAAK